MSHLIGQEPAEKQSLAKSEVNPGSTSAHGMLTPPARQIALRIASPACES